MVQTIKTIQNFQVFHVSAELYEQAFCGSVQKRLFLWTWGQRGHEELHLVHKVASLHLAPVHLLVRPSEVAPLGVLDHVAFGQLLGLAAGELDQNLAAALRPVAH